MYIFVSDVHLSEPQSKRYGAFLNLLDEIHASTEIKELFLVGDIFDMWVGDRQSFIDLHKAVVDKIDQIAQTKKVHYFEGNHDFQLGEFWSDMDVSVYPEEQEFEIKGQKVLVGHGDLLNLEDKSYLRLRWLFRTPLFKLLIKILPVFVLFKIGALISTTEHKGSPTEKQKKMFLVNWKKWTRDLHKRRPYDVFICGHYHFDADLFDEKTGARSVNLGTWLDGDFKVFEL